VCVGAKGDAVLFPKTDIFEAPFCCSMRGAEGLTAASTYAFLNNASEIVLPLFFNNIAELKLPSGYIRLSETTDYPLTGNVKLEILDSTISKTMSFCFFIPPWVDASAMHLSVNDAAQSMVHEDGFVQLSITPKRGDRIRLNFPVTLRTENASHPSIAGNVLRYFHGPLLLGETLIATTQPTTKPASDVRRWTLIAPATYRSANGAVLSPIGALTYLPMETAKTIHQQVLFPLESKP
jgi:DUF1680 family protein